MSATRTQQKVVRGGGTVEQWRLMQIIAEARRAVKTYTGSDGKEYPNNKYRTMIRDGKKQTVQYTKKEKMGIEYLTTLIAHQGRTHYSIVRTIKALRHPSIEDLLRHVSGNQPVTVAVTVYNIHDDKHVKLYQHPDGPLLDKDGNETNYPKHGQWLNSWKNRVVLTPKWAKDFRSWVARNKVLMDTIEAKYVIKQNHESHIRAKSSLSQAEMHRAMSIKKLDAFGANYDEYCEKWEAEEAWLKAAPKHMGVIYRRNISNNPMRYKLSPDAQTTQLTRNLDMATKEVTHWQQQVESLAQMFDDGGEEE